MRLLVLEWNGYGYRFIKEEFAKAGVDVVTAQLITKGRDTRRGEEFASEVASIIMQNEPDAVFTFNYFAGVAIACNACKVLYISWTYDSPCSQLYSETINLPTNVSFTFDRDECLNLRRAGAENVMYLPLCAPVDYYDSLNCRKDAMAGQYGADIAFVGMMYSEDKHNLFRHLENVDDYTKGYINGLFSAQTGIYGSSILEACLTDEIIKRIHKVADIYPSGDGFETAAWVIANYYLARKLTAIERRDFIEMLQKDFGDVKVFGDVDYYTQAPFIMKCSKINLNISLRSIVNAIPLRVFDIMGNGGFCLTDYRGEMQEFFVPGEDYVYYDSPQSLKEKCSYYMKEDKEREAIARNGYEKVCKFHTYRNRVEDILNCING